MRIRKRKEPLPLTLLTPAGPDHHHDLFSRSPVMRVVQQQHDEDADVATTQQPADHFSLTSSSSSTRSAFDLRRSIPPGNTSTAASASYSLGGCSLGIIGGKERHEFDTNNNDARTSMGTIAPSNNDDNKPTIEAVGSWRNKDGEAFSPDVVEGAMTIEILMRLKREQNNKKRELAFALDLDHDHGPKDNVIISSANAADIDNNGGIGSNAGGVKKAGKRGTTIMEGSRCSRVNGRGWRCCQPTLVGYSLCEHHLGKGRLRSMANAAKAKPSSSSKKIVVANTSALPVNEKESIVEDGKRVNHAGGKRVKLGVVKARSLSSLLGQTNAAVGNDQQENHEDEDYYLLKKES